MGIQGLRGEIGVQGLNGKQGQPGMFLENIKMICI
jgi:hypothetical protein